MLYRRDIKIKPLKQCITHCSMVSLEMYLCCYIFDKLYYPYFKEQFLKYVGDTCKKDEYQKVCTYIEGIAACKDGEVLSELYYYILNTFPRRRLLLEEFERVCWNVSFKKVGVK